MSRFFGGTDGGFLGGGSGFAPREGTAIWTPADIPGLALWLDNSLITEAAGKVIAWPDLSPHGRHFTQANPAIQPNYIASETDFPTAQPAVKFNVANSVLTCAAFAMRWVAIVGVYPATTFSSNPGLFNGATHTTERVLRAGNNGTNVWLQANTWADTATFYLDGAVTATALTTANAPHLWIASLTAARTPAASWVLGGIPSGVQWSDSIAMVVAGDQAIDAPTVANLIAYAQSPRGMIP